MKLVRAKISGTKEQIDLFHKKLAKLPAQVRRPFVRSLAQTGERVLATTQRYQMAIGGYVIRTYYRTQEDEVCFVDAHFNRIASARVLFEEIFCGVYGPELRPISNTLRVEMLNRERVIAAKGVDIKGRLVVFPSQISGKITAIGETIGQQCSISVDQALQEFAATVSTLADDAEPTASPALLALASHEGESKQEWAERLAGEIIDVVDE